ncbi:MAG: YgiQ family radical SAM protein [Candidatus Omnitrophota bacterium]|nr:YgiQ family radical SAM protein [Candidatus Omnitrophota bacterium]
MNYLPVSKDDLERRDWGELDVVLVSGDAYVDHPSYGVAMIGRVLEGAGFKVGVIAQPDWHRLDDFRRLGRPKLFFGVTAGNLDSMIANYTANKKVRNMDDYSPGGKAHLRPDRATIMYVNKLRESFKDVPIVIGGIEASMRRLAHYDYWSDKVRRSLLLDAKADILVYGMGETQIVDIARRLAAGEAVSDIDNIYGTVVVRKNLKNVKDYIDIHSFEDVSNDKGKFNEAFKAAYLEADPIRGKAIVQKHGDRFVIQYPPAAPLTQEQMDEIYSLPFTRECHPSYAASGGVPGFESVRNSIVSHRGCAGACNFCSLYLHQGAHVQSRSVESIVGEIKLISKSKKFKGTITDIGGPTANLYKAECRSWSAQGTCRDKKCMVPQKCKNLKLGYDYSIRLWKELKKIPGVKHVFVGSGVRFDLLTDSYADEYLSELCADHISGQLKVAPEHCADSVLELMNKPKFDIYEKFMDKFENINKRLGKKQYLVNYFIVGHPGADLKDALVLAVYLAKKHIHPEQVQDFIPLPMTVSGAMYHTQMDPSTGRAVYVAKKPSERMMQRALMQYKNPQNREYVRKALKILNREDLKRLFAA